MFLNNKNILFIAIAITFLSACGEPQSVAQQKQPKIVGAGGEPLEVAKIVPRWAAETAWLSLRADQQAALIAESDVFYDFTYSDQLEDSGITFVNRVVDDASRDYKGVHYDHGTGVSVADVDSDGILDIYFTNQVGANALWRGRGDGTFVDITENAGVGLADRISVGASFADIDNDGDQDLFVTTVRGGNVLFENDGTGRFKDVASESGLDYTGHSSGSLFFDYDNDGLLDLYVTNVGVYTTDVQGADGYMVGFEDAFTGHTKPERTESSILYHNDGDNRFTDVSESLGIVNNRWSGDLAAIDANNDGWMDLYILNMQGLDGYYENQQGKGFVDKSEEVFPRTSWGAMGIQIFDFDNDGDMDIYITDMHSDMADQVKPLLTEEKRKAIQPKYSQEFFKDNGNGIFGNTFFRNEGDGQFTEVSDEINAENFWPWGLSAGDLNADGYQDVFIASSMNYPWRYGSNSVMLNQGGNQFVDAEFALGVEPRIAHSGPREFTPWFVLECAGADKGHKDCPRDINAGRVTVYGALGSRSAVLFDIDGDGDLDIVTAEFGSRPMVLVSNLSDQITVNNIHVGLIGTKSNRNGFGATVVVEAGGNTYTQVMTGKTGYLSQSVAPLFFGLGAADTVDSVEVRWPSGVVQRVVGPIQAGSNLSITEQG